MIASISGKPPTIGAGVSVANTTELAALDVSTLTPGTLAYVVADSQVYQLQLNAGAWTWETVTFGGGGGVFDYDGWLTAQVAVMHAQAPALTNFREIEVGVKAFVTGGKDGAAPGGAVANDTVGTVDLTVASLFQQPKTKSWAIAFRAAIPATTSTNFNFVGLQNAAHTHDLGVAQYHTADSGDHYLLYMYNGAELAPASTVVADTAFHDFVVTFDGTTVKMFIDGTLAASTATLTSITDEAMQASVFGNVAGATRCVRFAYGYIAP